MFLLFYSFRFYFQFFTYLLFFPNYFFITYCLLFIDLLRLVITFKQLYLYYIYFFEIN